MVCPSPVVFVQVVSYLLGSHSGIQCMLSDTISGPSSTGVSPLRWARDGLSQHQQEREVESQRDRDKERETER